MSHDDSRVKETHQNPAGPRETGRARVALVRVYIEDINNQYFEVAITPEEASALFWMPPDLPCELEGNESDAKGGLKGGTKDEVDYKSSYANSFDKANRPEQESEEVTALRNRFQIKSVSKEFVPEKGRKFRVEETILGHYYESFKKKFSDKRRAGAAYAAELWCGKIDTERDWRSIGDKGDFEEKIREEYGTLPKAACADVVVTKPNKESLTPGIQKIPDCNSRRL